MPHLAHFGHGSFNLGHVMAKWSSPLQMWHPSNIVEEDGASGLGTSPLKKLMSVLFKIVIRFSIMVSKTPYSCSSFRDSYGVFPSFCNILYNFVAVPSNSSIFIKSFYHT
jgi:hypothetical protein